MAVNTPSATQGTFTAGFMVQLHKQFEKKCVYLRLYWMLSCSAKYSREVVTTVDLLTNTIDVCRGH